jgi:hypothetical protein
MSHCTPRVPAAGFALAEALVALLLLAIATIGAGGAMVHSLAGQRAALLRTQATDLAADLAEALRSAPDAAFREVEIRSWEAAVLLKLPQAQAGVLRQPPPSGQQTSLPDGFTIRLQWRDAGASSPSQLSLPVTLGIAQDQY